MAYRNFLILGIRVLFGLAFIPTVAARMQWQWASPSISTNQIATVTRTSTPSETITPSPSTDLTTTATATSTGTPIPTPTNSPTPTLNPTFTATVSPSPFPTSPFPPTPCACPIYLPLVVAIPPTIILEIEPNDTFAQAQPLSTLPVSVNGTHDGTTDTGDVYQIELIAGQIVHVTLTTQNPTGVQLLAYSGETPNEIVRDFEAPFELTFLAISTDTYFLYAFTPGDANNTGAYTISATLMEQNP